MGLEGACPCHDGWDQDEGSVQRANTTAAVWRIITVLLSDDWLAGTGSRSPLLGGVGNADGSLPSFFEVAANL